MKFIDKLERKIWKIWYSQSHNLHDCMLCDRLCTNDRESRHTELAEPGTCVYSAGTGMETGDLGTLSAEHLRSIMVCNCSSVLLLSNWNLSGADDWNF